MSVQMTIELATPQAAQIVVRALDLYKTQLQASIERTERKLARFEQQYRVSTSHFLAHMTAEDLPGGDLEYVEWAGESKLLAGLQAELEVIEHAGYQLP
ncbi:MAG: hypothetical protein U0401_04515 [Anaerolineae bacterium]